jgi:ATP synthase protein I
MKSAACGEAKIAFSWLVTMGAVMTDSGDKPTGDQGDRLKDFGHRLDRTVSSRQNKDDVDATDGMAASFAMRAIAELLVALAICTVGGYYLDRYLGTTPWFMIILMPLGQAVGIWNILRMGKSKEAEVIMGGKGPPPPSVKDDDDED